MDEVGSAPTSSAWTRLAGKASQVLMRSRAQTCSRDRRQFVDMAGLRRITRSGIVGGHIVAHIVGQDCDIGLDIALRYHTMHHTTAQAGDQCAADGHRPGVPQYLTAAVEGDAVATLQRAQRADAVESVRQPRQLLPVILQQLPGAALQPVQQRLPAQAELADEMLW